MSAKLLQNPDFRLYLLYRLCVTFVIQMQSVAVAWQVYELTQSPLHLGYVGLAIFVPNLIFALPGGRAADRYPRHRMMLGSVGLLLVASLSLLLGSLAARPSVSVIYATLTLIGLARAYAGPAISAYLPQLVRPDQLSQAIAFNSIVYQLGTIGGPALAGLLMVWAAGSITWLYLACTLLLSCTLLANLRLPSFPVVQSRGQLELLGGLRFIWQEKLILGAISLDLFAVLLGGAVALLPIYAKDILHVGPSGLGTMRSAPALGAAAMALLISLRPPQRKVGALMFVAVLLFGLFTILFGVSTHYPLSLFCLVMIGATDMISVVIRQTLIQKHSPEAMRGRISAVSMIFIGASNELGEFESGLTAAWLGAVPAVVWGGVGTCIVVALWCLWFPSLRRADSYDSR